MVRVLFLFLLVFSFSFPVSSQGITQSAENHDYNEDSDQAEIPRLTTNYKIPELFMENLLNRTSFFIGHNLSSRLEGLYYSDGSVKNISTNTAFSLGVRGKIFNLTEKIRLAVEMEYNTSRNLNPTSFKNPADSGSPNIFSPRFSFFNLVPLIEFEVFKELNSFVGLNFNLPLVSHSPFKLRGDFGFQGGAGYNIFRRMWLEGLVKVNNMNLHNNTGEKRDVSVAGLELRGRYAF